jgi:hypothetical protein
MIKSTETIEYLDHLMTTMHTDNFAAIAIDLVLNLALDHCPHELRTAIVSADNLQATYWGVVLTLLDGLLFDDLKEISLNPLTPESI